MDWAFSISGKARGGDNYTLGIFGKPARNMNCDCERTSDPTLLQTIYTRNDPQMLALLEPLVIGISMTAVFQPHGTTVFLGLVVKSTACLWTMILLCANLYVTNSCVNRTKSLPLRAALRPCSCFSTTALMP